MILNASLPRLPPPIDQIFARFRDSGGRRFEGAWCERERAPEIKSVTISSERERGEGYKERGGAWARSGAIPIPPES